MQEEFNQFERNEVWILVPPPQDHPSNGTKWIFKNELHEHVNKIKNKARLVAHGCNQEEGVDYEETFAPVARIQSIQMFLAFPCYHNFALYKMDVKSAFVNGYIMEEV